MIVRGKIGENQPLGNPPFSCHLITIDFICLIMYSVGVLLFQELHCDFHLGVFQFNYNTNTITIKLSNRKLTNKIMCLIIYDLFINHILQVPCMNNLISLICANSSVLI